MESRKDIWVTFPQAQYKCIKQSLHDRDAGFYQTSSATFWIGVLSQCVPKLKQIPKGLYVGMTQSYIKTKYDKWPIYKFYRNLFLLPYSIFWQKMLDHRF